MANNGSEDYTGVKKALRTIYKVGSKIALVLLIMIALFLLYIGISTKLYKMKGDKFKPKFTLYSIISPSMHPTIKVYDIIIDVRVDKPTDIKKNDIITFLSTSSYSQGLTVTHRVTDVIIDENGKYQYQTQGDNNMSPDAAYAPYENVLGKVVLKVPKFGLVQDFLTNGHGWILVVVIPTLIIIIKDILKLVKLSKVQEKANSIDSGNNIRKISIFDAEDEEKKRQESIKKRLDE